MSTISDFINQNSSEVITYNSLSIIQRLDDIEYPYHNVIYDFLDELIQLSQLVTLNSTEVARYKYRPDLLSYDLYGTDKYDFILLAINNIESDKYFDKEMIKVLYPEHMKEAINLIYNSQSNYLNMNREQYTSTASDKQYEL